MNKYQKQIDDLDDDVFANMGSHSQIVIDLVQDATDLKGNKEELEAFRYIVNILKEVFDPNRFADILALDLLEVIIRDWIKELE